LATVIEQAREYMSLNPVDGWLIYDFHGMNPAFSEVVGSTNNLTRPVFALVLPDGDPVLLAHAVDVGRFDLVGWKIQGYSGQSDLRSSLAALLAPLSILAMEYSPLGALPKTSRVDAGTIELVRSLGKTVTTSADLIQFATQRWTKEGFASHKRSSDALGRIVLDAFGEIGNNLYSGITEYDVADFIRRQFDVAGLWTGDGPVVAINEHASDPHFEPTPALSRAFRPGDWILIDLWAKETGAEAIFSDITWVAYIGNQVPKKHQEVFDVVTGARDKAVEIAKKAITTGQELQGWEVDKAARNFISERGYGQYFTHRTGHSLGKTVHADGVNMDNLETHDTRVLIPGLGFTIEPGIYLPEFGVRSEIDLYMSPGNLEITTPIQKSVVLIPG
jgi:Xaa-Pro dipeptidase